MDEYCPLCRKLGNNKKIRAIQLNYDEAVWMCEEERCPWPFGYEEFKFLPRRVEELSKNPSSKSNTNKRQESTSISTNLGVYTPPVTPSNEGSSKDSEKVDNMGFTPPNTITSPFIGKISPGYRSRVLPSSHSLPKQENPQISIEILDDKLSKPVSSIFDVDSSVSVGKIKLLTIKQGPGSTICDGKPPKQKVKPTIIKRKLKHVPQIRSIQTIPHNLIKIEIKEDLSTNSSISTVPFSPLKNKNQAPSCGNSSSTPKAGKRPSIPETNELFNFDVTTEVPKKLPRVSDDDIKPIVVNGISDPSGATNPQEHEAQSHIGHEFLQSNNYLEIMNLDGGNSSMENSGQEGLSLNGILDDMLTGNCQNMTQEIDDDWLNSLLL